jgi:putative addiction module component (TIGR02574 family)
MGNQARQLLEAALALPREERADLAEKLLASVEAETPVPDADMDGEHDPDPEVEKAWAEEITRRAGRALRGESKGVPWETVRDDVRATLGRK